MNNIWQKECGEPDGYYYLHTNGSLIFKRFEPEEDSPFVRRVWPVYVKQRSNAWIIAIEALAMGASRSRIQELQDKWKLTDDDAEVFAKRTGLFKVFRDGNQWCATFPDFVNIQESQCGFGATALDALAELAKPGLCPVARKASIA